MPNVERLLYLITELSLLINQYAQGIELQEKLPFGGLIELVFLSFDWLYQTSACYFHFIKQRLKFRV
jgi:hypothetical protein